MNTQEFRSTSGQIIDGAMISEPQELVAILSNNYQQKDTILDIYQFENDDYQKIHEFKQNGIKSLDAVYNKLLKTHHFFTASDSA